MEYKPKILKNNGKPSVITISTQKWTEFFDKRGNKQKIKIVMYRSDNNKDKEVEEFRLSKFEKCVVYWENDVYKSRVIRPITHTFTVESYPHLLNIHIGTGTFDERIYNFKVGEMVSIGLEKDFNELFLKFNLLDEVDEKGIIIKENVYTQRQNKPEEIPDYSKIPLPEMEELPINSSIIRRASPIENRVWRNENGERKGGLVEDKEVEGGKEE